MSVTTVEKDTANLSMTIAAEFDSPVGRVWQIWSEPRQLERWWGPPTYPATVLEHDLRPGGIVTYLMTGPSGDKPHGWWRVRTVEPPHRLTFSDGFGDHPDTATEDMPVAETEVTLTSLPNGRTRMQVLSRFPSAEAMQQMLDMGMEQGMSEALGQIDLILAE